MFESWFKWSSDVPLGKSSRSRMYQELRQRQRHTQRRLFTVPMQILLLSRAFWGEAFLWRVGHQRPNAQWRQEWKTFLFWLNVWFHTLNENVTDAQSRNASKLAVLTTWCCSGLSKDDSSDAEEVMSFYFSSGMDWSLFDINRINVLWKKPPRLSRRGKNWQPRAETPASQTKSSRRRQSVEHADLHVIFVFRHREVVILKIFI